MMAVCSWPGSEDELIQRVLKARSGGHLISRLEHVCQEIDLILCGHNWPKSKDEFFKWFWIGENGQNIMKKLQFVKNGIQKRVWPRSRSEFQEWCLDNDNRQYFIRKLQESTLVESQQRGRDNWPKNEYEFVSTWFWQNDKEAIFKKLREEPATVHQNHDGTHNHEKGLLENQKNSDIAAVMYQMYQVCDEIESILQDQMWPKCEEDFINWFWSGNHGNDLIKKLNKKSGHNGRIRREKIIPKIYAVVLEDDGVEWEKKKWKLCKVGSTGQEGGKRFELLYRQIESFGFVCGSKPKPSPYNLFQLPVSAIDTSRLTETERRIRSQVGQPFDKKIAERIKLPSHTEWVCTTQDHLDHILAKIEEFKAKDEDEIDVFDSNGVVPPTVCKEIYNLFEEKYNMQKKRFVQKHIDPEVIQIN